jgi:hypothetical protein
MKPQKLLMILGVSILIYYVARQVQIRSKLIEQLDEDRIFNEDEFREILDYYASIGSENAIDPSILSNKAKVFINTVTEHPFTAVTSSVMTNLKKENEQMNPDMFTRFAVMLIVPFINDYQMKHLKSADTPSKDKFITECTELIMSSPRLKGILERWQDNVIDFDMSKLSIFSESSRKHYTELFEAAKAAYKELSGGKILVTNIDGTKTINTSGPLQTNVIDLMYAYIHPTQDIFTWLASFIFG